LSRIVTTQNHSYAFEQRDYLVDKTSTTELSGEAVPKNGEKPLPSSTPTNLQNQLFFFFLKKKKKKNLLSSHRSIEHSKKNTFACVGKLVMVMH
jgi:hypothetical protein